MGILECRRMRRGGERGSRASPLPSETPMKMTILDDYHDTVRTLPCFAKLAGQGVTIHTDHVQDTDALAARLRDTEALVLIRERTEIRTPLLDRLPHLRLISQRSVYPHIDIDTCTRLGIIVSSGQHADTPSYATAELAFGLILAAMRQIPQQMAALQSGQWQIGVGHTLRAQDARHSRLRPHRQRGRRLRRAFGMQVLVWARDTARARAAADGHATAATKPSSTNMPTSFRCTCAWSTPRAASSPPRISRG